MKKLATLFSDSYREFQSVGTITTAAMCAGVAMVLGYFTIAIGDFIKIGFSTIPGQLIYYMFGPVVGGLFGGALDILKYLIKPTGAFFPGFTFNAILAGVLYGMILYKRPIRLGRILAAEFLVSMICNVLLGTLWLTVLFDKGFLVILPMRLFKNLIMWPVNSLLFFLTAKTLEAAGMFRMVRTFGIQSR